jgi:hypothetical protein
MSRFRMRPLWTPTIGSNYLGITLDRTFAEDCHKARVPNDLKGFEKQIFGRIDNKHDRHTQSYTKNGYLSLNGGILLSTIYANRDGLWLALDLETLESKVNYPSYTSHNDDNIFDRVWLIKAFDAWVQVASLMLNYES